jgi:hypothetical protein
MKKNYDKKTKLYRFVKVDNVNPIEFSNKDVSLPVFLDEEIVDKLKQIKENLYEYNGDYYVPSNYGFFKHFFKG